jgi:hypothetical protein
MGGGGGRERDRGAEAEPPPTAATGVAPSRGGQDGKRKRYQVVQGKSDLGSHWFNVRRGIHRI